MSGAPLRFLVLLRIQILQMYNLGTKSLKKQVTSELRVSLTFSVNYFAFLKSFSYYLSERLIQEGLCQHI